MKKKVVLCIFLLSMYLGLFGMNKIMNGKEIRVINIIFSIMCNDLNYNEKDIDFFVFDLKEINGNYEIHITDSRYSLGGDAFFIVDCNSFEIIKKSYGE